MENYEPKYGCPLSYYIQAYYDDNQQTPEDYKNKDEIRNWIEGLILLFGKVKKLSKIVLHDMDSTILVILSAVRQMGLGRINQMSIFA